MARAAKAQLPVHVAHGGRDVDCGVMAVLVDPGEDVNRVAAAAFRAITNPWASSISIPLAP